MEYILVATNRDVLLTEACYCSRRFGEKMNTVRYASRSAVSFSIQKPLVPNIAENISYVTTN
jgi:hypothetical protein